MADKVNPLTKDEQATLAALQQREALANWQMQEDQRKADLAELEPVVAALGGRDGPQKIIEGLQALVDDLRGDDRRSVERLINSLRYEALGLIKRRDALATALPKPGEGLA